MAEAMGRRVLPLRCCRTRPCPRRMWDSRATVVVLAELPVTPMKGGVVAADGGQDLVGGGADAKEKGQLGWPVERGKVAAENQPPKAAIAKRKTPEGIAIDKGEHTALEVHIFC